MSFILLRAGLVLPVVCPPIRDGGVAIRRDRILAVGPWAEVRRAHAGAELDLGENAILPGLINAHCHLDYTDLAGKILPPRNFADWIKAIVALKAPLTPDDFRRGWERGAGMLCRTGTTTVADTEAFPELLPGVWAATPLRVHSFREIISLKGGSAAASALETAVQQLRALPAAAGRAGLSPHAPYTTTPDLLRQAARAALVNHWHLVTHVAESEPEFEMFMYGQGPLHDWLASQRDMSDCGRGSPVAHLARCGYLSNRLLAVHANYLARDDASLLSRHQVSVVHCPQSHAYFRHLRFPRGELAGHGVNICLGTDSLASTPATRRQPAELNMFAEMRALAAVEPGLAPATILRMATLNGALALGRQRELGELGPGARADLIVIPLADRGREVHEAVLHHPGPVRAAMIDGRWAIPPAA